MSCLFRTLSLLLLLIGGSVASVLPENTAPDPLTLTCGTGITLGNHPTTQFSWQAWDATAVRADSGSVDDQGVYHPGGWHAQDDLPLQGSGSLMMKIDNYAVRVCVTGSSPDDEVCAVCDPFASASAP